MLKMSNGGGPSAKTGQEPLMIEKIADFFRRGRPGRPSLPGPFPSPDRVLVIYDDQSVRHWLVNLLLGMEGLDCRDAGGGPRDLKRAAARLEPDLILLDSRWVGARSRNLVRRLKRRHPDRRVFLLGLDDGPGYHLAAQRAGADGYVSTTRVVESLEKILGRNLDPDPPALAE
jgi:CheY-like chemotaxis protein